MEHWQITQAIDKARKGISQYLEIMELLPSVDVAADRDFQRKFNAFYRIRQRSAEWYKTYYAVMQQWKGTHLTFDGVLDRLWQDLHRYEPSFSSKLVATLDPDQPVWDRYVLDNTRTKAPSYASRDRLAQAKAAYRCIQTWYREFLGSHEGSLVVRLFSSAVKEHASITDLKKVDFVLWQIRGDEERDPPRQHRRSSNR